MKLENIVSFIGQFNSVINAGLFLIVLYSVGLYFYTRSGSAYSILDRLWTIFLGHKKFNNPTIESMLQERKDIDKFNALFNVDAIDTQQIIAFNKWIKKYNYDTRKISRIKGWFKIESLKIKKANHIESILILGISISLLLFSIIIIFIGSMSMALIKIETSEPWIWVDHTEVRTLNNKIVLNKETCLDEDFDIKNISERSRLTNNSIRIICQNFNRKEKSLTITNLISGQKTASYSSLLFIFISFRMIISFTRAINVSDSRRSLMKKIKEYRKSR